MEETLQLFSFFVSFVFGLGFHFLTDIHFNLIASYHSFFKYLSTILFMLDIVLGYLFIMYQLNEGVIHIYFLFFVFLGFFSYGFLHRNVKLKNIMSFRLGKFKK